MSVLDVEARRCLERVRDSLTRERPVAAVFDLDNTLFDTRPRTVHAARTWDDEALAPLEHPIRRMSRADVGWNGRLTALLAGLDPAAAEVFHQHWNRVFWDENHFSRDLEIPNLIRLLKAVQELEVEVWFLTGRIRALDEASMAQLNRLGVADPGGRLLSKPHLGIRTVEFKRRELANLKEKYEVAFFASDSADDVSAGQDTGIGGVLVEFPVVAPDFKLHREPDHTIVAAVPPTEVITGEEREEL